MSYSGTIESRKAFSKTSVIKDLLRILHTLQDEKDAKVKESKMEIRVKALKALINFSQDEAYMRQMCEVDVVKRIYELLKENVRQDLKNAELSDGVSNKTKINADSGVFEVAQPQPELVINKQTGKLEDAKEDL